MPLSEMRSMIDTLFAYANPNSESFTTPGSIRNGSFCLAIQGGSQTPGTAVELQPCNYGPAQTWVYDRRSESIVNPASETCLDVRDANLRSGTPVQIWPCNGTDAQRWSWDPDHLAVENALGTVLDVQWGTFSAGTPVWTWTRDENPAQQWVFPDAWDGLARCVAEGRC
jgi:hypothetical protein